MEGLECDRVLDASIIAAVQAKPLPEIARRLAAGHQTYVALVNGQPAGFGWVATDEATIGELDATVRLPERNRYLWNFVTLPEFRGRGIYPRLLREILADGRSEADWWWIMYAPENRASGSGIEKAGFIPVAAVAFDERERAAFRELRPSAGPMVERLLGVPQATGMLTPCWKCVRAGRGAMACADDACRCDYQRPDVTCAA